MENTTSIIKIRIFTIFMNNEIFIFSTVFLFLLYCIGILGNILIFAVICWDLHLHTPLYLFLSNLSIVDMCFITVTVPNLLHILLSGDNTMSYMQCMTQMFFLFFVGTCEDTLLFVMGYDRYVAICHPLHYHQILNKKICILLMMIMWICSCVNSSLLLNSILKTLFCSSLTIHQYFCDAKALINISCGGTDMFYKVFYANCLILGLFPSACNVMSYVQIFKVILRIQSKDGRSKAFSTCSSHLTVLLIYYGSGLSVYLIPPSERYNLLEQILSVFYLMGTPLLNPLIYSLRNNDMKDAMRRLKARFLQPNASSGSCGLHSNNACACFLRTRRVKTSH